MAADLNHVTLIGRLTRDAELKYTSGGFAVSNFSVAVNRRRKSGDQWMEEASFFEINLYGKSAENLKPYLTKGKQVALDGELRQDRWEQDGQSRSKVVIVANNVQLLGGSPSGGSSAPSSRTQPERDGGWRRQPAEPGPQEYPDAGSAMDADFPDDIPF